MISAISSKAASELYQLQQANQQVSKQQAPAKQQPDSVHLSARAVASKDVDHDGDSK